MYSSIRQLYCCDITDIRWVPHDEGDIHEIYETFEKSYLLIGLSKFAQTFVVRFLKSSSIHPISINAWGSFSFNSNWVYSQSMPLHSESKYNSEIRVTLTRNGVDSQLTPFRVKFDSAEIRVYIQELKFSLVGVLFGITSIISIIYAPKVAKAHELLYTIFVVTDRDKLLLNIPYSFVKSITEWRFVINCTV